LIVGKFTTLRKSNPTSACRGAITDCSGPTGFLGWWSGTTLPITISTGSRTDGVRSKYCCPEQIAVGAAHFSARHQFGSFTDSDNNGPWSVDVDWGDGSAHTTFSAGAVGALGTSAHTYADGNPNTVFTVTVMVTDQAGDSDSTTFQVTVANVPPGLTLSGATVINEGDAYTLNLSSSDPGTDTITGWTINWGDGDIQTVTGTPASVTHAYADGPSNYTTTATASDEDGTFAAGNTVSVTVNNVAPTLTISGTSSVNEGATYALNLGVITDPGQDTITSWIVHWGDGNTDTFTSGGNHTHVYADGAPVTRAVTWT
jgi:hypothetical protein